jgi:hypothetical protein
VSRLPRLALGTVLAAACVLLVAAGSQLPYTPPASETATLRLSWRARGERVEECRKLSVEEQERLPAHMRRDEVCEGRILPSQLWVEVDGRVLVDDPVYAAGARGDRPLYVLRELPLPPGRHVLRVRFSRDGNGTGGAVPPLLELSGTLDLAPAEVALVTYDPDARALVLRTPGPSPTPRR